jgi:hypothetical protein
MACAHTCGREAGRPAVCRPEGTPPGGGAATAAAAAAAVLARVVARAGRRRAAAGPGLHRVPCRASARPAASAAAPAARTVAACASVAPAQIARCTVPDTLAVNFCTCKRQSEAGDEVPLNTIVASKPWPQLFCVRPWKRHRKAEEPSGQSQSHMRPAAGGQVEAR